MTVEAIVISTNCWCCGGSIRVNESCYKPYTCSNCHDGKHPASEWLSDEYECKIECGENCGSSRTLFLKRKATTELFKKRETIRCKGCKSKKINLLLKRWYGGAVVRTSKEGTPILPAKEWRDVKPEDILVEAREA